ncbi:MAG: hypothetical protein RIS47_1857 [Bacteroidota bacterium]
MIEPKDAEILKLYREGRESAALNLLVNTYKTSLYWHIRKIVISHDDTDDILQDTFVKAWKGISSFRDEAKLYTWLYRIATNESLNLIQKRKRNRILPWGDKEPTLTATLSIEPVFCDADPQEVLRMAIETLPDKQRIVFNMRYFDEMPYIEMAQILQTSEGALKASYHHAVKKIEQFVSLY